MPKIGFEAKLYHGVAGATAATELTNCRDLTLNLSDSEVDVTTRANGGWKATDGGLRDASLEWEMVWDPDDTGFQAIRDAYINRTAIALAALDEADGEGLDADFAILQFNRPEPLDDALKVNVVAKPTYSTRVPAWVEPVA